MSSARFTTCRVEVIMPPDQQKRRGKYSFRQHNLNLYIEVKCAFDFSRLISSADGGIYFFHWLRSYEEQVTYNLYPPAPRTHSQPKIEALHLQQPVHNPCCNAALVHDFKLCAVVSRDECDHIGICSKACACYL